MDKGIGAFSHWMGKMSIIHKSSIFFNGIPRSSCRRLPVSRNGTRFVTVRSKKEDTDGSDSRNNQLRLPFRVSRKVLASSLVVLFGLGFIDAGYSGDWSRIGVISEDVEDSLKIAAFLVVPLCIFLVFYFSKEPAEYS